MFWSKPNKNIEKKVVEEPKDVLSNAQLEAELENLISKRNELIIKPYFAAVIRSKDGEIKDYNLDFFTKYMLDGTIDFNKIASCIDHDEIITSSRNNTTEKRWYFNKIERFYEYDCYKSYNIGKDHNQYIAIKYYAEDNKYFVEGCVKTGVEHVETKCISGELVTYSEDVYSALKSEGYDDLNSLKQAVANFVEIVDLNTKIHKIRSTTEDNNHKQKCAELEAQAWGQDLMKGISMIEKTCPNCIKWFECKDRLHMYNREVRRYKPCEFAEVDDRLDGRTARCADCGSLEPSAPSLPFFMYRPDNAYDSYYCGCYGWD